MISIFIILGSICKFFCLLRLSSLVKNDRNYMPEALVGCEFIIEQGVEASATSLVARALPRTHWKAEKGRGMNKCKFGGGVGSL